MTNAQALTKEAYEDPVVVRAFGEANRKSPSFRQDFAESLTGRRLLDAGCGPGRDAHYFAGLALEVMAFDYSEAMIEAARAASVGPNPPRF